VNAGVVVKAIGEHPQGDRANCKHTGTQKKRPETQAEEGIRGWLVCVSDGYDSCISTCELSSQCGTYIDDMSQAVIVK